MDAGSPPLGQHDHSLFLLRRSSREGWRKEICKYVRRGEARQTHGRAAGVRQRQQRFHAEFLPVAEREDEEPEHCLLAPEYHIRIKYGERRRHGHHRAGTGADVGLPQGRHPGRERLLQEPYRQSAACGRKGAAEYC